MSKATQALLAGLLFDADGHAMELVERRIRRKRVYRYYVAPQYFHGNAEEDDGDAIRRVPAHTIEDLVRRRLGPLAGIPEDDLDHQSIKSMVARIEIHPSAVRLVLRIRALGAGTQRRVGIEFVRRQLLPGEQVTTDPMDVRLIRVLLPVRLKVRGGRNWIVGNHGEPIEPVASPDKAAIQLLRKAHGVLRACGVSADYSNAQLHFARAPRNACEMAQVRWAFLAPDIQQAVMEGRVAVGGPRLKVPLLWSQQRALW